MRIIKCDRCGREMETYMPVKVTMNRQQNYHKRLCVSRKLTNVWEMPVDMCEPCEDAVYDFITKDSLD